MVTVFNRGAEELLGYPAEEVVGRLRIDALHEPGELRAAAAEAGTTADFAVLAAGADVQPQTRDWTYVRKDGSRVVCSVTVSAVRDAFDAHIGYLAVARDVTESRRNQQLLVETLAKEREAVERLRELDRAKSDFVSMVSHELRTPITSIVGYSEMLQEGAAGPVSSGQERLLDAVRRNGDRLIALIEDLLTLSRIEAGTFTLEKARLDLGTVMAAAEEALSPLLAGRRLDVRFTRPSHAVELEGDPAQLERVILNLVGNAVKFTEDGGHVTCALRTREDRAVLTVSDTGIGIPAEEQEELFRRFFRSSTAQERAIQGTGLGLSIVQSIVHSHGGQIAISSEHLVGTEVSVELPLVELPRELVASARPGSA
jgi:PAS domain S-box-containing protein